MKMSQLTQMIEKIIEKRVKEELSKRLPMLVESVLTKRYLKDLVSEHVQNIKPTSLREAMANEEEDEVPRPLPNNTAGVYEVVPLKKENRSRVSPSVIQKLTNGDRAMAALFEGVEPASSPDSVVSSVASESVPEPLLEQLVDMNRVRQLAAITVPKKNTQQLTSADSDSFLKQQRKRLDERYVGEKPRQLPSLEVSRNQISRVLNEDDDPFEAHIRELERKRNNMGL